MEQRETKHSIATVLSVLLAGAAAVQGLGWAAEGVETSDRLGTANLSQTTVEDYEDYIEAYDASDPEDDPLYVRMMDNGVLEEASADVDAVAASLDATLDTLTTASPYTGKTYTHESRFSDSVVLLGIDVSHWQAEIDWEAVAADGVTFAFIRCGYTGTTNPFHMVEDTYFQENIQGAYDAGIAVGIYYFSQALTVEEAEQEAAWTLSLLEPYQDMITLPVVYDLEKVSGSRTKGLSAAKTTANALAWLEAVKSAGYTAYYYGSTGVLGDLYDLTQLTEYDCWVARYNTATRSDLSYDFWQYASVGSVDGIDTAVDCDFYYMDGIGTMGAVTVTEGSGGLTLSWPAVEGATHYQIYRSTASNSGFTKVQTVSASQLSYADTGLAAGTTYYYKVRAYSNAGYLPAYSGFSPSVSGTAPGGTKDSDSAEDSNTEKNPGSTDDADSVEASGSADDSSNNLSTETAVTTAPLNLRSGAGTGYSVLTVLPKGATVTVLSRTNQSWYQVSYTDSAGTAWTGYAGAAYLTATGSSSAASDSAAGETATTTVSLNLRSGAGTSYSVIIVLPKRATVTILSKTNYQWYQVSYTSSAGTTWTGYAGAAYLTVTGSTGTSASGSADSTSDNAASSDSSSASDSSAASDSAATGTATTTAPLNLRSGPGSSYSVVTVLPKGVTVTVLGKPNSSWYKVSYTGSIGTTWTGYVGASYLSVSGGTASTDDDSVSGGTASTDDDSASGSTDSSSNSASSSGNSDSAASASAGETAVTTASLNLRSGPGSSHSVVTVLPSGAQVTVLDKSNRYWYKVSYTGSTGATWTGYVGASYLTVGSAAASSTSNASSTATTACPLNLRSGPGSSYSVVTVLPGGVQVTVLDKSNSSWYKVSYTNASGSTWTGYVGARYLQ